MDAGLIERQVAILNRDRLAPLAGHGLDAIVEITLDRQGDEAMEAFEARVVADAAVQQCYRVSPGPDFVLVVQAPDMPGYLALAQRLFTQRRQRAQREGLLRRQAGQVRAAHRAAATGARLTPARLGGAYLGAFFGRFQPAMLTCLPRATVSAPGAACPW